MLVLCNDSSIKLEMNVWNPCKSRPPTHLDLTMSDNPVMNSGFWKVKAVHFEPFLCRGNNVEQSQLFSWLSEKLNPQSLILPPGWDHEPHEVIKPKPLCLYAVLSNQWLSCGKKSVAWVRKNWYRSFYFILMWINSFTTSLEGAFQSHNCSHLKWNL